MITRVKLNISSACLALGKNPGENSVLTIPDEGFGFNVNKLHRTINDKLKDLQLELFTKRVQSELPKDDQRRRAFEASDSFSNSFPISIDSSVLLSSHEFTTAIQRKLGLALTMLAQFVGYPIATNGKSRRLQVDAFGNNVAAAPGVSGDHARTTHDAFNTKVVLHIKEIGNGNIGFARLDYMRATTTEAANAQKEASKLFANGGKPTGILMIDRVLKDDQRKAIKANFADLAEGDTSRIKLLEADMKYQQINLTPQDQQLLDTRKFTVEEICRWFSVPPVMVGHSNVTAWGSGVEQIIEGFFKSTIRPALVRIEQAVTKRVLTSAQRATLTVEISFDALLRANLKDRMEIYAKGVQNGLKTRNECRQLENDPPIKGGDELTAQTNLAPLRMLGQIQGGGNAGTSNTVAQ